MAQNTFFLFSYWNHVCISFLHFFVKIKIILWKYSPFIFKEKMRYLKRLHVAWKIFLLDAFRWQFWACFLWKCYFLKMAVEIFLSYLNEMIARKDQNFTTIFTSVFLLIFWNFNIYFDKSQRIFFFFFVRYQSLPKKRTRKIYFVI